MSDPTPDLAALALATESWAMRLVRSRCVLVTLAEFEVMPEAMQAALAQAGDIVYARAPHPDSIASMLAAGFGEG